MIDPNKAIAEPIINPINELGLSELSAFTLVKIPGRPA